MRVQVRLKKKKKMINRVILMGRLTADPELKQTPSGVSVCRLSIAVNRPKPKDGEQQADFINVIAWRQTAEFVSKYFAKGKMIIVEGALRNNNYTDQNGVKHYSMEVQADNVSFGESKSQQDNTVQNNTISQQKSQQNTKKSAQKQQAKQETLDSFNTNFDIGDLSDFEVLNDGTVPF